MAAEMIATVRARCHSPGHSLAAGIGKRAETGTIGANAARNSRFCQGRPGNDGIFSRRSKSLQALSQSFRMRDRHDVSRRTQAEELLATRLRENRP
jgi:hypothetical protein